MTPFAPPASKKVAAMARDDNWIKHSASLLDDIEQDFEEMNSVYREFF
jgi:hypothetical protein